MTFDERDEDRIDLRLRELARDYHEPPSPPREEMWAAIAARRAERRGHRLRLFGRPWTWGLAAAAVLALGVALGRWSAQRGAATDGAAASAAMPDDVALRLAATEHLTRAEALLTAMRARSAPIDAQFRSTARELLSMTRLLLDTPAAGDAAFRTLLEDLELLLAQMVQLGPAEEPQDLDLITEGLEQRDVLTRLRTAIPAGVAVYTQGVL